MSKALNSPTPVLPVMMIGVMMMMMMSLCVSAQPTVNNDEACCQSGMFEELLVNQFNDIRADIKTSSQKMEEQLAEVKNLLGSRQQPSASSVSDSSTLCECKIHYPLQSNQGLNLKTS